MKHLITYSLHDYLRSHKYFPPTCMFIVLIFVFYTYKPNPVIDSYAVTALMVYVISAWLCISVLSLDPPRQAEIFVLQLGSWNRYYLGKLLTVFILSVVLTTYVILYPILFNMFEEPVTATTGLVAFMNHLFSGILGISVASLFSKVITKSAVNSFGGLSLVIVVSLAALGISGMLPSSLNQLVWIIPPATATQGPLYNWNGEDLQGLPMFPFIWIIIYSFLLVILFLQLAKRLR